MTGAGISTHVLDTTRGVPAAGVAITLYRREGGGMVEAGSGTTGDDGRVANLLDAELTPGWYQIVFDLAPYYGSQQHFFSRVTLDIAIAEARHHHVPLLVSPFSCSSYRGS
jgi:5-hydroxyisourate hydrolase